MEEATKEAVDAAIEKIHLDPNEYRLLIFGLAMVAMMVWRPRGLIAQREPSVVLKERKAIASSLVKEGHG